MRFFLSNQFHLHTITVHLHFHLEFISKFLIYFWFWARFYSFFPFFFSNSFLVSHLGLVKTFVKTSLYEDTKNCGFCFLEYDCHSSALKAKRLLNNGSVWGRQLFVDWAQRRKQPDDSDFTECKTIFINNLPKETTDEQITEALGSYGTIEKITRIKDYAFVLFAEHQSAENALSADKAQLGHENIEISMAMPKSMKKTRSRFSMHPSYRQNNYERNGRNRRFKRFNTSFGSSTSSGKFYLRKQHKTKRANGNDNSAGTAVEQTTIPMANNIPAITIEPVAN